MSLRFKGSAHFRQRLLLSTLSGKAIRIDDIRSSDQSPGLRDFEASLLRLLEKLTNGCLVEINETGDNQEKIYNIIQQCTNLHQRLQ
jgi:RNA 3'-terminal phosphate cyclase-like protein